MKYSKCSAYMNFEQILYFTFYSHHNIGQTAKWCDQLTFSFSSLKRWTGKQQYIEAKEKRSL